MGREFLHNFLPNPSAHLSAHVARTWIAQAVHLLQSEMFGNPGI